MVMQELEKMDHSLKLVLIRYWKHKYSGFKIISLHCAMLGLSDTDVVLQELFIVYSKPNTSTALYILVQSLILHKHSICVLLILYQPSQVTKPCLFPFLPFVSNKAYMPCNAPMLCEDTFYIMSYLNTNQFQLLRFPEIM